MDKYTEKYYDQEADTGTYEGDSIEIELRKTIQRQKKTLFRLMEKINRLRITCAVLIVLLIIETFLWWGNSGNDTVIPETPTVDTPGETDVTINIPEENIPDEPQPPKINVDPARIDSIITTMTLEEKIYQMIITTPENLTGVPAVTVTGDTSKAAIEKYPVGGLIYSQKNIENKQQVYDMLSRLQSYSKIKLFLAIEENGDDAVMTNPEVTVNTVSKSSELADASAVQNAYGAISDELVSLGFNVNLAPYADATDKSSENFGTDVQVVSEKVKSAVSGLQKNNVAPALKLFPSSDSSTRTATDMKNAEFLAFKAGINAGADFVIVSCKNSAEGEPFSMSDAYMNKALKTELAFGGIVVADDITAPDVAAKYTQDKAAVKAINSGADMLICPIGVSNTVNAILAAVEAGEISEKTINDSVKRILGIKLLRSIVK